VPSLKRSTLNGDVSTSPLNDLPLSMNLLFGLLKVDSASEMTYMYIVSGAALNSTHSLSKVGLPAL